MEAAYIQIRDNLFYKIETGKTTAVNTKPTAKAPAIRDSKTLPSAYMNEVKVIDKETFDNVYNQINNDTSKNSR